MRHYLWELRPYFRQVAGELVLGSIAGIVMNTAVVLPAILLGHAIDTALALERGQATPRDVGWAALAFVGGTLLSEGPRMLKRWWLMTANARIRANIRADAVREFIIETWDTVLFSLSLIVAMLFYNTSLTALVLLPTPLALLLSYATGRWVSSRTQAAREANANMTALLQEQLAGLRVL